MILLHQQPPGHRLIHQLINHITQDLLIRFVDQHRRNRSENGRGCERSPISCAAATEEAVLEPVTTNGSLDVTSDGANAFSCDESVNACDAACKIGSNGEKAEIAAACSCGVPDLLSR